MSDAHVIADLISRADALWPRRARRIPDMKAWLSTAKDMLGRRTVHEAEHATLRSRALPYTDADRALDDRRRPELYPALFAEIDRAQQGLRNINRSLDHQVSPRRREELLSEAEEAKQTLADLTENQAVRERITYRFEASQDAWRHRVLTQLVHQLELLPDLVADVEARLAFAQTVKARTVIQEEERWRTCIDDVLSDPRFQGIALSPQVGLIPLGKDADSTLWEFWMPETGAEPGWSGTMLSGKTRVDADSSVVFVLIPGGTFTMGSQRSDPDAPNYDDATVGQEGPAHQVQLTPFLFGKYEITQGVWVRTLGANPAHYFPGREVAFRTTLQCPVENVSWLECRDMLQRHGLILPTEAQWEYAARAGTQTPWWSGPTIEGLDKAGNVADVFMQGFNPSSNYETTLNDGWAVHAPVGTFNPNAFGIHDTIGNILEWCRDPVAHYEVPTLPGDGLRQDDSNRYRDDRVTRGGSYIRPAFYCRSAWRYGISQNSRQSDLGVRPSRTIDP
jgi:formylglycine-generating enzyme required for sulfatase activity